METMETLQPESQSLPVVKEPPGSQQPGRVRCQRCGIAVPWQVPLIRHCGRPTCQVKSSGTTNTKGSAIYVQYIAVMWCLFDSLAHAHKMFAMSPQMWHIVKFWCGEWGDKVHAEPWSCTAGLDLQDSNFSYGFHLGKSTPRLLDSTSAAAQEAGVTYGIKKRTKRSTSWGIFESEMPTKIDCFQLLCYIMLHHVPSTSCKLIDAHEVFEAGATWLSFLSRRPNAQAVIASCWAVKLDTSCLIAAAATASCSWYIKHRRQFRSMLKWSIVIFQFLF